MYVPIPIFRNISVIGLAISHALLKVWLTFTLVRLFKPSLFYSGMIKLQYGHTMQSLYKYSYSSGKEVILKLPCCALQPRLSLGIIHSTSNQYHVIIYRVPFFLASA